MGGRLGPSRFWKDRGVVPRSDRIPSGLVRRQRRERLLATRAVRETLISLAGLVMVPVLNQAGDHIGRVVDVVARWDGQEPYPPVTGLVAKVGSRIAFVGIEQVAEVTGPGSPGLGPARSHRLCPPPG